ncbi:MMPL family transporter [Streptomyces roseolus]|uniref:MMPL family transporter n=1 Tax=Streptomyces roseolus TaxID=67358 RepID=UPI0036F98A21
MCRARTRHRLSPPTGTADAGEGLQDRLLAIGPRNTPARLPLLTALIGVAIGLLGTMFVSGFVEMTGTATVLALMIGLAVGIDYALFVISRHREQLAAPDADWEESIARATATAGSAVVFAGATVVIALAALAVTGIPFLTVMGLAGAGTVLIAVLVAISLLPAVLGVFGQRQGAVTRLRGTLVADKNVAAVSPPVPSRFGDVVLMAVMPKSSPDAEATTDLVHRMRDQAPKVAEEGGALYVTGQTAMAIDVADKCSSSAGCASTTSTARTRPRPSPRASPAVRGSSWPQH